jgi:hypothetical protein
VRRIEFIEEVLDGWRKVDPGADLRSVRCLQQIVWSGRLAEELLERTPWQLAFVEGAIMRYSLS